MAAGPDFQVARPTQIWQNYTDGTGYGPTFGAERFIAQMSNPNAAANMRDVFRSGFEPLIPATTCTPHGLQNGEEVTSWPELAKRYHLLMSTSVDPSGVHLLVINPYVRSLSGLNNVWGRIVRGFHFIRGGYRLKFVVTSAQNNDSGIYEIPTGVYMAATNVSDNETPDSMWFAANGVQLQYLAQNNVLEIEIPFYNTHNMISHGFPDLTDTDYVEQPCCYFNLVDANVMNNIYFIDVYISASDNTTFGWPLPPIPLFLPSSGSKGKKQILNGGNQPGDNNHTKSTTFPQLKEEKQLVHNKANRNSNGF